jgi:hypothetical protein
VRHGASRLKLSRMDAREARPANDGGATPEDVAARVFELMQLEHPRRVIAVWPDGSITVEDFGFYGRRRQDRSWDVPLLSFPAGSMASEHEILQRLRERLRLRALLRPAPPASP